MSLDGESLFSIVKCVHLLLLAKVILLDLHENFAAVQVGKRFIYLYNLQRIKFFYF